MLILDFGCMLILAFDKVMLDFGMLILDFGMLISNLDSESLIFDFYVVRILKFR